jgi:hypothetical protein
VRAMSARAAPGIFAGFAYAPLRALRNEQKARI